MSNPPRITEVRPDKVQKMTHASVFSGIGGPEVAAAMLGWKNLFHCEINPFGRSVLEYWFPESESYEDITRTDFTKWRGKVDVLTGGFPCQPFSVAGKRGGASDERYLWPQMLRVIDEIRPAWVVGENVAGIATVVQPGEVVEVAGCPSLFGKDYDIEETSKSEFVVETICRDLESLGYSVQPVLIPACAVGAPHRRDRIFFLACLENTERDGCQRKSCDGENESSKRGQRMPRTGDSERICGQAGPHASHAANAGVEGVRQEREDAVHGLAAPADPYGEQIQPDGEPEQPEDCRGGEKGTFRSGHIFGDYLLPGNRWRGFPTVSPVHRGNDGLPFPVDRLAIPFGKWSRESIRAYGNAIVPQVMYRIFQAIEDVSQ